MEKGSRFAFAACVTHTDTHTDTTSVCASVSFLHIRLVPVFLVDVVVARYSLTHTERHTLATLAVTLLS